MRTNRSKVSFALPALLLLLATTTGCVELVESDYGERSAYPYTSLNGTRILSDMFEQAGHKVRTWYYLSPALERADVIVWFPDDFDAPTYEVEEWLGYWMVEGDVNDPPRVLIIVGRDFDAAPYYWKQMQGSAPAGLKNEYARRLGEARADARGNRPNKLSNSSTNDWYKLDDSMQKTTVKKLTGPWAEDVDSTKAEIVRHTRMDPISRDVTILLADGAGDAIVTEQDIEDNSSYYSYQRSQGGRLITIENGSWLLNARLVNKEHRKLAGRLVDSIGAPRRSIVFLESGAGGPPIRDEDPSGGPPTGFELFRVWPIGAVLTQVAVLGIVFAFMKWPIFGIPRKWLPEANNEFSSHVTALGSLLAGGGNRTFAIRLLKLYRQSLRREHAPVTEISHAGSPLPAPSSDPATLE